MNRSMVCAIAWWYLLYPPATHKGAPDRQASLSKWEIDGSYGTAADCDVAHFDDLNSMLGLEENSQDRENAHKAYLQTQAGRYIASDDPRLAK